MGFTKMTTTAAPKTSRKTKYDSKKLYLKIGGGKEPKVVHVSLLVGPDVLSQWEKGTKVQLMLGYGDDIGWAMLAGVGSEEKGLTVTTYGKNMLLVNASLKKYLGYSGPYDEIPAQITELEFEADEDENALIFKFPEDVWEKCVTERVLNRLQENAADVEEEDDEDVVEQDEQEDDLIEEDDDMFEEDDD